MKKIFLIVGALLLGVTFLLNNEGYFQKKEAPIVTNYEPLNEFFKGDRYETFKMNFEIKNQDIQIEHLLVDKDSNNAELFKMPIVRNGVLIGKLIVFTKAGKESRLIYEDLKSLNKDGKIGMYTSDKLIASFEAKKVDETLYEVKLISVADKPVIIGKAAKQDTNLFSLIQSAHAQSELGNPSDGWWTCTTQCVSYATSACANDAECLTICALLDMGSYCLAAIATACAGHCI